MGRGRIVPTKRKAAEIFSGYNFLRHEKFMLTP
jgi:hypothetical protein